MTTKILEWLNKTGYPLELFGEATLLEHDFTIINSHLYLDNEKTITRELDLFAERSWDMPGLILTIELLIECKKSDKPFLLLANKKRTRKSVSIGEYLYISDLNARVAINNPNIEFNLAEKFSSGFKIVQAFVDGDEVIHKASNTLLKAYQDWHRQLNDLKDIYINENHHSIAIPLLLIDAPFFEVRLDERNQLITTEIDSGVLEFKSTSDNTNFPIPVIVKSHFQDMLSNILILGQSLFDFLKDNPQNHIKNFEKTDIVLKKS